MLVAGVAIFAALAQAQSPIGTAQQPAPTVTPNPKPALIKAQRKALAKERAAKKRKARKLRKLVRHYRKRTWYWQDVMQKRHKRSYGHESRAQSIRYLKHLVRIWKHHYRHAKWQAHHPPPSLWAWLCIHRHEGPWNSSTNPIYDGGLQMNDTFQYTYGRKWRRLKGPAYNWTKWEQIWTGVRAWRTRGFGPWPNTRIPCGV